MMMKHTTHTPRAGRAKSPVVLAWCLLAVLILAGGGPALAGSILNAKCPCGYESGVLLIFGGRANFTTYCGFPVYCRGCPELSVENLYEGEPGCPACSSEKGLPYDDPSLLGKAGDKVVASWNTTERLGRVLKLTDGTYLCPACGAFSLTFQEVGLWD